MEVEFDTRFKHPFSMIVAGSSGSGKTVFTKQVLRSADVEFEKMFWFYSEWQEGYRDCTDVTFVSGMPSSLDSYLESTAGPKLVVFDDMMTQCANSEMIAQAFTQKRQRRVDSAKLVLPGQGHAQRPPQHGVRGAVSQSQRQESVWTLCPAAGAEEIQGPDGRLRGRDVSTLLSSAGGPQAPHAGRAAIQERLASTGPSSRLRGWHCQLLTGGPRRGPPGGSPRAPPPPPLP